MGNSKACCLKFKPVETSMTAPDIQAHSHFLKRSLASLSSYAWELYTSDCFPQYIFWHLFILSLIPLPPQSSVQGTHSSQGAPSHNEASFRQLICLNLIKISWYLNKNNTRDDAL